MPGKVLTDKAAHKRQHWREKEKRREEDTAEALLPSIATAAAAAAAVHPALRAVSIYLALLVKRPEFRR